MPLGFQLYILEDFIVNSVGSWVAILVSVVITAFFIPNMLRKGTVDLLIVKPIRRSTLLLYKYVGGLLFILLNTAVAKSDDPVTMALSMRHAVEAGRLAYRAGRIPRRGRAEPSSPQLGLVGS